MPVQRRIEIDGLVFYPTACGTCKSCGQHKPCPNKTLVAKEDKPRDRSSAAHPVAPVPESEATQSPQSPEPDVEPTVDSEILQGTTSSHESSIWSAWTEWEGQMPETNDKDFVSARSIREVFKAFQGGREDVKEVLIKDFLKRPKIQEYIAALIEKLKQDGKEVPPGSKETDLVYTSKHGTSEGTWLHKRLAVEYARALCPEFAVWLDGKFLNHFGLDTTDPQKRSKTWKATTLTLRESDGFISANAMRQSCVAPGDYRSKRFDTFCARDDTQAYIKALATYLAKRQSRELCQSERGGSVTDPSYCRELVINSCHGGNDRGSTWIHPRLAVCFARWLDPHFAVWMDGWFLDVVAQSASPSHAPDLCTRGPPAGPEIATEVPPRLPASPSPSLDYKPEHIYLDPGYSGKHLYAMTVDGYPGVLKIGQSKNILTRETQISGTMRRQVRTICIWHRAGELEKPLHNSLKDLRVEGLRIRESDPQGREFFQIDLESLKNRVQEVHGNYQRKLSIEMTSLDDEELERECKRRRCSLDLETERLALEERALNIEERKQALYERKLFFSEFEKLLQEGDPRAKDIVIRKIAEFEK